MGIKDHKSVQNRTLFQEDQTHPETMTDKDSSQFRNWRGKHRFFYRRRFSEVEDFEELLTLIWENLTPEEKHPESEKPSESKFLIWLRVSLHETKVEEFENDPITVMKEFGIIWKTLSDNRPLFMEQKELEYEAVSEESESEDSMLEEEINDENCNPDSPEEKEEVSKIVQYLQEPKNSSTAYDALIQTLICKEESQAVIPEKIVETSNFKPSDQSSQDTEVSHFKPGIQTELAKNKLSKSLAMTFEQAQNELLEDISLQVFENASKRMKISEEVPYVPDRNYEMPILVDQMVSNWQGESAKLKDTESENTEHDCASLCCNFSTQPITTDQNPPENPPPNSFILFLQHQAEQYPSYNRKMNVNLWNNMSEEAKLPYHEEQKALWDVYNAKIGKAPKPILKKREKVEKKVQPKTRKADFVQRPPSAYQLWVQAEMKARQNGGPKLFSRQKGPTWNALSEDEKRPFMEESARLWNEFEEKHPELKSKWRRRKNVVRHKVQYTEPQYPLDMDYDYENYMVQEDIWHRETVSNQENIPYEENIENW